MSLYLLPLTMLALAAAAGWLIYTWIVGGLKRSQFIASAHFDVQPRSVKAHDTLTLTASVKPKAGPLKVRAVLVCALMEHRERRVHAHVYPLGGSGDLKLEIQMPDEALRSGVVGNELSNLFSEDVHRALVSWYVLFEVVAEKTGEVILEERVAITVPEGHALTADRRALEQIIVEKCKNMHDDMVLNWLVHLAAADGTISEAERRLLREILVVAHEAPDDAAADARIEKERGRELGMDVLLLKQHMPPESLDEFYRLLYAMAWRDGSIAQNERTFLDTAMRKIGMDKYRVNELEREVLADVAAHSIR